MKQFILLLALAFIFGGCITDSGDNSDDLIGLWKSYGNQYTITFRADGSYNSSLWSTGSYKADGNKLTLKSSNQNPPRVNGFKYYQDGDFLTVVDSNNVYYDFIRERP